MNITFKFRSALAALMLVTCQSTLAQDNQYPDTWDPPAQVTEANVLNESIAAALRKFEEWILRKARDQLSNPTTIYRLGRQLGEWVDKLRNDNSQSDAQKIAEFIRAVEIDSRSFEAIDQNQLSLRLKVQYSPAFGVTTLSWDRLTARYNCQRVTTFPNFVTEVWDEEAHYYVWADGKLLAHFPGRLNVSSPATIGVNFTFGTSVSVKPAITQGSTPFDSVSKAGPFYDFLTSDKPQYA